MNMIKLLWCRFQRCLSTFTILLVEASSETGLYKHLSDYDFGVRNRKCEQAVPRFFMSIRGTFSDSIDLAVTIESDKHNLMQV